MPKENYDFITKVILIGEGESGKTSLINKYCEGNFDEKYKMTIGANLKTKVVDAGGLEIKMIVWDLAGQPQFNCVRKLYYEGANICLTVFDLTREKTFRKTREWVNEMVNSYRIIPQVLVGNKVDLKEEREVDYDRGLEYAKSLSDAYSNKLKKKLEVPYIETSAKTGENVELAFITLAKEYLRFDYD